MQQKQKKKKPSSVEDESENDKYDFQWFKLPIIAHITEKSEVFQTRIQTFQKLKTLKRKIHKTNFTKTKNVQKLLNSAVQSAAQSMNQKPYQIIYCARNDDALRKLTESVCYAEAELKGQEEKDRPQRERERKFFVGTFFIYFFILFINVCNEREL